MEAVPTGFEFFYFETLNDIRLLNLQLAQFIVDIVDPQHGPLQRKNLFRQKDEECATCVMHYMEVRARVRAAEPAGMVRGLVSARYMQIRSVLGSCMTNLSKARKIWIEKEKEREVKQGKLHRLLALTKSKADIEKKKAEAVAAEYAQTASAMSSAGAGLPDFPLLQSSAELRKVAKEAATLEAKVQEKAAGGAKGKAKAKAKPKAGSEAAASKAKAKATAEAQPKAAAIEATVVCAAELSDADASMPSDSEMVGFKALQQGEELPESWTPPNLAPAAAEEPPELPEQGFALPPLPPPAEEPPEEFAPPPLPPAEEPPEAVPLPIETVGLPQIYPLEPHQTEPEEKCIQEKLSIAFLKKFSEAELLNEMHSLRQHSKNGQILNGLMMAEHVRTREGLRKCSACRFSSGCTRCSFPHAMRYVLSHSHAASWWDKASGQAMREVEWATWGC